MYVLEDRMRGPKPPSIELTADQRRELETLVRRHTTAQQIALRGRIVLAAAAGCNNAQIARDLALSLPTVRRWRERWIGLQCIPFSDLDLVERLTDVPRPGRPIQISDAQVCQIVRIGCEAPAASGRPITEWTGREIADEAVRRKIVDRISPRHAARLVKRGISNRIASEAG
jgi:homeodomain-containing protein